MIKNIYLRGNKKGFLTAFCEKDFNAKLIKSGNAWVYKSYRSNEYLMNLENFARNNSKGLWSNKKPTEPWVFRKINKK